MANATRLPREVRQIGWLNAAGADSARRARRERRVRGGVRYFRNFRWARIGESAFWLAAGFLGLCWLMLELVKAIPAPG